MTVRELNRDQLTELKRMYYAQLVNECLFAEVMGVNIDEPSYEMIERVNEYVPDEVIFDAYDNTDARFWIISLYRDSLN